VIRYHW